MLCPHCNAQIPDEARYCSECGGDVTVLPVPTKQTIATTHTNATSITSAEEKARNTKIGVIVVASIGLVAVVCAIAALLFIL